MKSVIDQCSHPLRDVLHNLVPFVQFKEVKKQPWRSATLLKVTFLHECFSRFLNCTNGKKSRKAFHIETSQSIVRANQLIDFYNTRTLVANGSIRFFKMLGKIKFPYCSCGNLVKLKNTTYTKFRELLELEIVTFSSSEVDITIL